MYKVFFRSVSWSIFIVFTLLSGTLSAQTPAWYLKLMELKPLESTRSQVEKLFGPASKTSEGFVQDGIETVFYSNCAGRFSAEYGTDESVIINGNSLKVGKDALISIVFFPSENTDYNVLKIDHGKFYKFWDGHDPAVHYINESLGIDHAVVQNRVIHVELRPRKYKVP